MAGIGGVVVQFRADASKAVRETQKLVRSLKDVDKNASTASKGIDGFGKVAKFGMAAAGAGVAAVGVGIVGLGTKMVMLAANFEESQNILQAALGATADEMEKLSDLAKEMGKQTVFSAQDASDAMIALAKAGLTTADIMGGGVQAAMALAATEGLDLADAAGATANAMNAFGIAAKDLPTVADALAGASKSSTASVSSLMLGLQQVGQGAKTAGLSLQETVGILAAFDSAGIKGSDAGTSLKTMLTRLIPMTKKAQAAFVNYGLAVYDSKKAMKSLREQGLRAKSSGIDDVTIALMKMFKAQGMTQVQAAKAADEWVWVNAFQNQMVNANGSMKDANQIAQVLAKSLGDLSESARIEAGSLLFGSDAARAGSILADLGKKGLTPFIEAAKEAGVAAEQADARTKGLKGKLEALGGAAETIGIQVGEKLLPVLTGWITRFTDFLDTPKGTKMIDGLATQVERAAKSVQEWVDGTLIPAVQSVYDWFGSPSGQQAIKDWGDAIKTTADAIAWLAEQLGKLDKFKNWLKGSWLNKSLLPDGGKPTNWTETPWSKDEPAPASRRVSKPFRRNGSVGMNDANSQLPNGVTVNVYNGKQEKTDEAAALALRIARKAAF